MKNRILVSMSVFLSLSLFASVHASASQRCESVGLDGLYRNGNEKQFRIVQDDCVIVIRDVARSISYSIVRYRGNPTDYSTLPAEYLAVQRERGRDYVQAARYSWDLIPSPVRGRAELVIYGDAQVSPGALPGVADQVASLRGEFQVIKSEGSRDRRIDFVLKGLGEGGQPRFSVKSGEGQLLESAFRSVAARIVSFWNSVKGSHPDLYLVRISD